MTQADAQAQYGPRQRPAQQAAAQKADRKLSGDQSQRTAQRSGHRAYRRGACQFVPGTVAAGAPGADEKTNRAADDQSGPGVTHIDRLNLDHLDVQIQPEKSADRS
ncbi:MAG: hypothetical protein ACLP7Q_20030 [Isosphaeraceae bacterium]